MIKVPTSIYLRTLDGKEFDFSAFARTHDCVVFIYPKIGEDFELLSEQLQKTAGMKGCTKQAINYKKLLKEFNDLAASNRHKFYFRQTLIIKGGNIRRAYIVDEPENDAKNMLEKIKNEDY